MSKIQKNIRSAFTLFEVLIALAILSIAMVAGMVTTDNVLERTVNIEKKILAHFVGMNVLNSIELKLLKNKLEVSEFNGDDNFRGQTFNWAVKISKINFGDNAELFNVKVTITDKSTNMSRVLDELSRTVPGVQTV